MSTPQPPSDRPPSLMDPEATGGDVAEGGFRFQDHVILARIPGWLATGGFEQMIREALGDTEARFFHPVSGETRELVELKNHRLAPAEFWSEVERFATLDSGSPGTYSRFVIGCTGMSDTLKPVMNALRRVRGAFPFYEGSGSTIRDASFRDFVAAVAKLGKPRAVAEFLFEKVSPEDNLPDAENLARETFREALLRHFPRFNDRPAREIEDVRVRLDQLLRSRKSVPITRAELEALVWPSGGAPAYVRLHTASRTGEDQAGEPGALTFDWSAFSGRDDRDYPSPEDWASGVVAPLVATREWVIRNGRPRRIHLSGTRRLSGALAIGAVFSAVQGFTLDLVHRGTVWSTGAHADAHTPAYDWNEALTLADGSPDLFVAIGITRDVVPSVDDYLAARGVAASRLGLTCLDPILSDQHTNRAVANAKSAISRSLVKSGASRVHLFLAGPSHFAACLGHRLNATAGVTCYEWVGPNRGIYTPTVSLPSS